MSDQKSVWPSLVFNYGSSEQMKKQDKCRVIHFSRLWKSAGRVPPNEDCINRVNGPAVQKLFISLLMLLVFLITPVFWGKIINEVCKNIYSSMLLRVALNSTTWVIVLFWETVDNHFLFIFSTLIEMHEMRILHLCQVSTLKSPFLFSLYF